MGWDGLQGRLAVVLMSETENPSGKAEFMAAHREHPRHFKGSRLIYPVLSRRSQGVSVGVNLVPDQCCNFDCLYCQVHRVPAAGRGTGGFSLRTIESELRAMLSLVLTGQIYKYRPFHETPASLQRLTDIALSGDGEPTGCRDFEAVCRICGQVKEEFSLDQVKLVLLTNASLLHLTVVKRGLEVLDAHQGEIWAKLDAGTEDYFQLVNQTSIPLERILSNLIEAARARPVVIQSLFVRLDKERPCRAEIRAYAERLDAIIHAGGRIAAVQLHTIARVPRDARVSCLSRAELDEIAGEVAERIDVPLEKYYA